MADPTVDQNGNLSGPRRQVRPSDPAQVKAALSGAGAPQAQPGSQPPQRPVGSSAGTPGLAGAINDAIGAAAKTFGPQSIVQRKQAVNQQVGKALGDEF